VAAADLDADGDLDVLSASREDDEIAWYENTDGAGSFGPQQLISEAADFTYSVFVGDVDRDGDLDVLSASSHDNEIAWYSNEGGQFALPTADTVPASPPTALLLAGTSDVALRMDLVHRGRTGDADIELATVHLRITGAVADTVLEEVALHADDGSGSFEPAQDPAVLAAPAASLDGLGNLTFSFADGDPNAQIAAGQTRRYFVVLEADASISGSATLSVTHVTATTAPSGAEDAAYDLPLALELHADTTSGLLFVTQAGLDYDADGLQDVHETDTGVLVGPTDTGTDPFDPDTDDDGLADGAELANGADPFDQDSDDDGLADGAEVDVHGTDPTDPDSDGDGIGDAFEVARGSDPTDPGDPFFQPFELLASALGPVQSLAAGDVDLDLDVDVLAARPGPQVDWIRNDSPNLTAVAVESIWDQSPTLLDVTASVTLAQLDGAGRPEPIVASQAAEDYLEHAGPLTGDYDFVAACGESEFWAAAADLDADGDTDLAQVFLASAIPVAIGIGWCENPLVGGGPWAFHSLATGLGIDPGFEVVVAAADLDLGGSPEIVVASASEVTVYADSGGGNFAPYTSISGFSAAVAVAVADLNADSSPDLVVADRDAGSVSWFEGPGFSSQNPIDSAAPDVSGVAVGDFDEDGEIDVAATSAGSDEVRYYRNLGSGASFGLQLLDATATGVKELIAADVDADGDLDLVAAVPGAGGGEVRLYRNGPIPASVPSLGFTALLLLAGLVWGIGSFATRRAARRG
jgi:hypothetical protein